jgi:hypothetical protein
MYSTHPKFTKMPPRLRCITHNSIIEHLVLVDFLDAPHLCVHTFLTVLTQARCSHSQDLQCPHHHQLCNSPRHTSAPQAFSILLRSATVLHQEILARGMIWSVPLPDSASSSFPDSLVYTLLQSTGPCSLEAVLTAHHPLQHVTAIPIPSSDSDSILRTPSDTTPLLARTQSS